MANDSFEVEGPGGFRAIARGSSPVFLTFLALLLIGFISLAAWWQDARSAERASVAREQQQTVVAAVHELKGSVDRTDEKMVALIWVLSRPAPEREALNLQKPDVLRRMSQ